MSILDDETTHQARAKRRQWDDAHWDELKTRRFGDRGDHFWVLEDLVHKRSHFLRMFTGLKRCARIRKAGHQRKRRRPTSGALTS